MFLLVVRGGLFVMSKIKQASIENFKHLSNFSSLKEFNSNMESFLACHKADFTKSEYIAFMRLTKFACKVVGVANASIRAILKAINDKSNGIGISESSFQRMKRKAVKMGILSVTFTERSNGSQSSNLWVFNQFINTNDIPKTEQKVDEAITVKDSNEMTIETPQSCQEIYKTNNLLTNRINEPLTSEFVSERIPKKFIDWVKIYFNDAKVIEDFWNRTSWAAWKFCFEEDHDLVLQTAIDSFFVLIRKIKFSSVKDKYAFFYKTAENKFLEAYFQKLEDMGFPS